MGSSVVCLSTLFTIICLNTVPINCHVVDDDSNVEEHFEKLYVKRLSWFKIDTPIGSYNSDWALVKNKQQEKKTKKGTCKRFGQSRNSCNNRHSKTVVRNVALF
ncbi:hypothetical protein [Geobacillus thermoleovorans]|uniref:restriction endonuclease n=1 Tax=Geobacillus thermoleovorans TaxID=33941 RepID=UPI003D23F392